MARMLVDAMSVGDKNFDFASYRNFDFASYRDTYQDNLRMLVEAKVAGQEVATVPDVEPEPRVINLMEALQKSLEAQKKGKLGKLIAASTGTKQVRKRRAS